MEQIANQYNDRYKMDYELIMRSVACESICKAKHNGHYNPNFTQEVSEFDMNKTKDELKCFVNDINLTQFGILDNTFEKSDKNVSPVIYYQGWRDLVSRNPVGIVGAGKLDLSSEHRIFSFINKSHDIVCFSSLASNEIERYFHKVLIDKGVPSVVVLDKPLSSPEIIKDSFLQTLGDNKGIILSKSPFLSYANSIQSIDFFTNESINLFNSISKRLLVLQDDGASSYVHDIVSKSLENGNKVFVFDNCFLNDRITWPNKFLERGIVRVKKLSDLEFLD